MKMKNDKDSEDVHFLFETRIINRIQPLASDKLLPQQVRMLQNIARIETRIRLYCVLAHNTKPNLWSAAEMQCPLAGADSSQIIRQCQEHVMPYSGPNLSVPS